MKVGVFVEGANEQTVRGKDDLTRLWEFIVAECGLPEGYELRVFGITKQAVVLMDNKPGIVVAGKVPFDVRLALEDKIHGLDRVILAFDAIPKNQLLGAKSPCLKLERDFVLSRLVASESAPKKFRDAAGRLLSYYAAFPALPRGSTSGFKPDALEVVYMAPCFEDLILRDLAAVRRVFGLASVPPKWPSAKGKTRPDFVFGEIVDASAHMGPPHLRVPYRQRKHAWALEVLKGANAKSPIWRHPIAERMRRLSRPTSP